MAIPYQGCSLPEQMGKEEFCEGGGHDEKSISDILGSICFGALRIAFWWKGIFIRSVPRTFPPD